MSLFAIGSDTIDLFKLVDDLNALGWTVHGLMKCGKLPASIHINIMPSNCKQVPAWIEALKMCVAKQRDSTRLAELGFAIPEGIDLDRLSDGQIDALLQAMGLATGIDRSDSAAINRLLNNLDAKLRDRLLTAFFNLSNTYREGGAIGFEGGRP